MSMLPIHRGLRVCARTVALILMSTNLACPSAGTSGANRPETHEPFEHEEARRQEARQVARQVAVLAGSVRDVDSRLELTFWAERGALTLVGYQSLERGGRAGRTVDHDDLQRTIARALMSTTHHSGGEVVLRMRREPASWALEPGASFSSERPLQARQVAGRREDATPEPSALATDLRRLLEPVRVPADGTVWANVSVHLRDGRVVGWELEDWRVVRAGRGNKTPRPVSRRVVEEATSVVRLYAPGTGSRSLHLGLRLIHEGNAPSAEGWVEETRMLPLSRPSGGVSRLTLP
ncbi:hypothetical protein HUW62_03380 [Myxococcus sp. AM011]|uniref:hypothetical protein n=1 Tax=Myxococcus sp. AM011 TaxID=2745200 RepID=UPI001595BD94|nr:hypothetical protein [Myxococcus sp. AM011]NVJ20261.1 hypothetical protein [Myxococcus sp. AM011]